MSNEPKNFKQLAKDIYNGRVYTDRHLQFNEILSVFMVLMFVNFEDLKDVFMIYEHIENAGPMCVNGNPTFMSMKTLNKTECTEVQKYYDEYKELNEKFDIL